MKQVTIKSIITMMLATWLVSGCQKETLVGKEIADAGTVTEKTATAVVAEKAGSNEVVVANTKSVNPDCSVCDANTKAFNLLDQLKTSQFKEGSNAVRDLGNGIKAIAQVKKGQISQWILQDKTGKTYLPQSSEKKAQQAYRPGGGWGPVWVFCYFTPWGWYCIWVIAY